MTIIPNNSPNVNPAGYFRISCILRTEWIICPECLCIQQASVFFCDGDPFNTYIHYCQECGYVILESEWYSGKPPVHGQGKEAAE